jgi:uncharacterized membrane protein (UPF0127 family)
LILSRVFFAGFAAALLVACRAEPAANVSQPIQTAARVSPAGLDLAPLTIRSDGRMHRFVVEVARTPEQQAQGLMFRESLGPNEGMIFPFTPPRPASFWMRNTLIPLDMIFIRVDGTIARIAANTVPLSEDSVAVGEPVAAVLEIRGGRAAELGITDAAYVTWQYR